MRNSPKPQLGNSDHLRQTRLKPFPHSDSHFTAADPSPPPPSIAGMQCVRPQPLQQLHCSWKLKRGLRHYSPGWCWKHKVVI
ncbi:hypothetical protein AKJ16_DCAP01651 [Drosera capensis]